MSSESVLFKWFKEPVELLMKQEHAGFALMMIPSRCFEPVTCEQDSPLAPMTLSSPFFNELVRKFPDLKDEKTRQVLFGRHLENGLLHQATFSMQPIGRHPNWRNADDSGQLHKTDTFSMCGLNKLTR
jgi:hypothetical protein